MHHSLARGAMSASQVRDGQYLEKLPLVVGAREIEEGDADDGGGGVPDPSPIPSPQHNVDQRNLLHLHALPPSVLQHPSTMTLPCLVQRCRPSRRHLLTAEAIKQQSVAHSVHGADGRKVALPSEL